MVDRGGWGAVALGAALAFCRAVNAQVDPPESPYPGQWSPGFNHQLVLASPGSTTHDHMVPFPGATLLTAGFNAPFNAIHMSLIPRGKDRGKVIVWDSHKCM
jgi:hypothetical protein